MANFEIDTTQETVNQALRKIETSDPVHANVYNLLFEQLINNDAFLERLANKMIQKAMVAHVLDSNNANMVLGADQAPALTALIDVERERITRLNSDYNVLNTKIGNYFVVTGESVSVKSNTSTAICSLEFLPGTYIVVCAASYESNATGYRNLTFRDAPNITGNTRGVAVTIAPANQPMTVTQVTHLLVLEEKKTYYCNVRHTAEVNLECLGQIRALQIK